MSVENGEKSPGPLRLSKGIREKYQGYSGARPDVLKLVHGRPRKVLDIGTGAGILGRDLAAMLHGAYIIGVEPDPELAELARSHMDEVVQGGIDDESTLKAIKNHAPFDLIVCADVLEHLPEPGVVLARLVDVLAEEGRIITSIPNVRHISTFVDLALLGNWPSRTRGIHDSTHLRFFTRKNILALGARANLKPLKESRNLRIIESMAWTKIPAKILDFWPLRPFFTFQYLHVWKRVDDN